MRIVKVHDVDIDETLNISEPKLIELQCIENNCTIVFANYTELGLDAGAYVDGKLIASTHNSTISNATKDLEAELRCQYEDNIDIIRLLYKIFAFLQSTVVTTKKRNSLIEGANLHPTLRA